MTRDDGRGADSSPAEPYDLLAPGCWYLVQQIVEDSKREAVTYVIEGELVSDRTASAANSVPCGVWR